MNRCAGVPGSLAAQEPLGYAARAMSAYRPSARAGVSRPSTSVDSIAEAPDARASNNSTLHLERSGLRIGNQLIPIHSGALHYFRLAPEHWRPALEALRELGLNMVESYVPWGVHETADGSFDFGEQDPSKNLGSFLNLAREVGLNVFLRPGPNVNAELPFFGLPRRIVMDERNQARSARGRVVPLPAPPRMFPTPSYASRHLRAENARWFEAVARIAAPHCWPNGPVVLVQADNEAAFYFRDAAYDADYHPDALLDFARFLALRYGSIDRLNAVRGTAYERFDDVPAPRSFTATSASSLPPQLDWIAFRESTLVESLAATRSQFAAAGLAALPVVHNLPMGEGGLPASLGAVSQAVDLVGLDYYHRRDGLETTRRRTLRLVGSSKHAFSPELGVGAPAWFPPRTEADSLIGALCACAYGLRGFNLYMAVDRDRWYGAPIDVSGAQQASAESWRRFITALRETSFHTLTRRAPIALSIPKEYAQLTRATHALGALSPSLLDLAGLPASSACRQNSFGFEQPIQLAWEPLLARLDEALCAEQIPFVYVESDTDLDQLPDLRVVFAPSFEFADPERWRRLQRFAQRGGTVVWGPRRPEFDMFMQPYDFAIPGELAAASIGDLAEATHLVRSIAEKLGLEQPLHIGPPPLRLTMHADEQGPRVLFAINPGSSDAQAELRLPLPLALRDALTDECFARASSLTLQVARESCRMLIVERSPRD